MRSVMLLGVLACSNQSITETRMVHAPPRAPDCPLAFVETDITHPDFNATWDVLGYVTLTDSAVVDPFADENRRKVRPRACAMGGTSIAIAMATTNQHATGTGSGVSYMVLRPKSVQPNQTTF